MSAKGMGLRTLECHDIVLRALTRSSHIDRENSQILAAAFILRPKDKSLSVSYDCLSDECAAGFDKCYGVATLHVGRVRSLKLNVVPDEPPHANIIGIPHPEDDIVTAERIAGQLQQQARLAWLP